MTLSLPQQRVVDAIRSFTSEHGYPPSIKEICTLTGMSSTSTVFTHLRNLQRLGVLVKDPSRDRAMRIAGEANTEVERLKVALRSALERCSRCTVAHDCAACQAAGELLA